MRDECFIVVVTGPPAGGKSSAARAIAGELAVPFLSKDEFKERLYEVFGAEDALEEQIERAALAILFSVAASQLRVGVSVVVESNFDSRSDTAPLRELAASHDAHVVQVHLSGPVDEIVAAFARRAASGERHRGHGDNPQDAAQIRADVQAGRWDPLALPGELIAEGMDANERQIAARVRDALRR
jgi:predicted kinase